MALLSTTTLIDDYLPGVSTSDTAAVATLGRALDRVEGMVAAFLGYPGATPTLASTSYTLRLAGVSVEPTRLLIPAYPVTAISSVYQDEELTFAASTLVDSGDYEQVNVRGATYLDLLPTGDTGSWLTGRRSVKVTCTAGYANEAAMPKALADLIYQAVADWYKARAYRVQTNRSEGGVSVGLVAPKDLSDELKEALAPWVILGTVGAT
jgi:hypothetical protein